MNRSEKERPPGKDRRKKRAKEGNKLVQLQDLNESLQVGISQSRTDLEKLKQLMNGL